MFEGRYCPKISVKPCFCFSHPSLETYRDISTVYKCSVGQCLVGRVFTCKVPEWTSNVVYYKDETEYNRRTFAVLDGIRSTIAFPVFDSHGLSCCAVLEIVTMVEKQNFDFETEKVFEALQAADLRSNASPRLYPQCLSRDQRAGSAEIADVIRAVCQKYGLPLALTWIPCDYNDEAVDELSKLCVRVGNSRLSGKSVLCIERTACYADNMMQGFVHACEQRYIEEGQGVAGKTFQSNLPFFNPNVKAYHITDYPLVHHARKYNLNAAVAIWLRSTYTGVNYILEFFLPVLMMESLEQQYLLRSLPVTLQGIGKGLRRVSDAELVGELGSKVGFEEGPIQSIPSVQTTLFKGDLNLIDAIPLYVSGSKTVGLDSDDPHRQEVREKIRTIEPVPNDEGKMFITCANNKRRKTSEVWKSFDKVKEGNGAVWAICKGCNKKYPGESTKGTSNLHKHLKSCPGKRQQEAQQHSSPSVRGMNLGLDQEKSRLNLAKMIMKLGCPLDMVQQEAFKTFVHGLQPNFQLCSQDFLEADVLFVYRQEKEKLITYLHSLSCLFSLTVDLQPYTDKEVCCCLTLHFIDDEWYLKKMVLAFRNLEHDYDSGNLHEAIKGMLGEWGINKNSNLMFAEISPPNGQMVRDLKGKLFDEVSCRNGDLLFVSSYSQILDLLVRDGFNEIQSVLHKIRETIKYVNGAPNKKVKFQEAINQLKLQDKKIASHDDPTRWDSTFLMLKRALQFRTAFIHLEQVDIDFKVNPSTNEWKMAMDVCQCLKMFHKSLCNSASSIDAYFLNVCYIYKNLLQWDRSEHAYVCSMAKRMKMTLDKYWVECGLALAILLVLDPRFKLKFLLYGYEQIYGNDANLRLWKFRNSLACIFNKYANGTKHLESSATKNSDVNCLTSYHPNSGDQLQGFCEWLKENEDSDMVNLWKSDLDRYLEEPLESMDSVSDILAWWHVNSPKFPVLGKMARDFLAIHKSMSTSSNKTAKMNPAFNGLRPEVVEALICGQDWLESIEKKTKVGNPDLFRASPNVRYNSPNRPAPKHLAGPFMVSKPSSQEDLKLIQYVFDSSLEESEIVARSEHYFLTRGELCSLRPKTYLDDIVISMMSDALTLVERKKEDSVNWYLPIYFAKFAYDTSECITFAKKQRIRENHMSALFRCKKMYVPVFDNRRSHFYLYVLHMRKQIVEIWDSLAESSNDEVVIHKLRNLLVCLDMLFKDEIEQNYPDGWSFANFRVERPTNIPQQPNGYDCGVYVIKFMVAPEEVKRHDFVFDSDEERVKVVLRLLDADVNLCRNALSAKAVKYFQQNFESNGSLSFASWQEMSTIKSAINTYQNAAVLSDDHLEQEVTKQNSVIGAAPNDDGKMVIINKRRKTSEVWKSFDEVKEENGAVWAICKGCNKKYPGESTKGTSNLHKHLKSCSGKRQQDAQQHSSPSDSGMNFVFDQEMNLLNLAKMVMKLGLPLDMVQQEAFKTFIHGLQPKFQLCSQDSLEADVLVVYRQEKAKLIKYFHNLSCLFSLTVDLQPYNDKEVHCCLTLQFVDEGWELKKIILAFRNLGNNYDAGALHEAIKSMLAVWNVNQNLNFMFAEISPTIGQMVGDLKSKLFDEVSSFNGDFFCVSSYAQILDLLVRDGFYGIQSVLHKIRESIKYVNGAPSKRKKFQEAINQVTLQDKKIASLDNPTRWDTTFVMLKRALHLRKAFTHLEQGDIDFKVNPSAVEWNRVMDVCNCLKVFYKSLHSSSSSIDAYFLNVCYIYKILLRWAKSEHVHVCSMAKRMKMTLDKYWSECGFALGILLVLDPRFKLKLLLYGSEQIYGVDANINVLKFRNSLTCIFNKYAKENNHLASSDTKSSDVICFTSYDPNSGENLHGFCDWLKQKHDSHMIDSQKSDLDRYLEEPLESLDNVSDILAWWRVNSPKFPVLGKMARDFLAIHISKSTHSNEARKMNPTFNGLRPEVVEALICGQDWLESFERNTKEGNPGFFLASPNVRCNSLNMPMPKYQAGPFMVSKQVSEEDLKLIRYIFDPSLEEREMVAESEQYYLSRKEFRSLRPQASLDDMVISMMSDVLALPEKKKEHPVNWYLPILLARKKEHTENRSLLDYFKMFSDDLRECFSFAKRQRIWINHTSDLFCEKTCCSCMFLSLTRREATSIYMFWI